MKSWIDKLYQGNESISMRNITNIIKDNTIDINTIKRGIVSYFEKQSNSNNYDYNSEYMEEYTVDAGCEIKALHGQSGAKAKKDSPRATIMGCYMGNEMLVQEFQEPNSLEYYARNLYLMSASFDLATATKKGKKIPQKIIEKMKEFEKIIIEPNRNNRCLPSLINDCRKNIYKKEKTDEDKNRQNVEFIEVSVNLWPMVFVVSLRPLCKGEQLFADYGDAYHSILPEYEYRQEVLKLLKAANRIEKIEERRS